MKVLYIDQTGLLGGGELSLLDWLRTSPQNSRVVLFSDGPFRNSLEELGIPVEILSVASMAGVRRESGILDVLSTVPAWAGVRKRLSKAAEWADVLYANSQKAFFASALSKRRNQPLVWHLRDIMSEEHFSFVLRKAAVIMGNTFATRIIVNSQASADAYVAAGGRRELLAIVPDGIDPDQFDGFNTEAIQDLRAELCPSTTFLVGIFGRLADWKGQHLVLEAIAALPGTHLCVVGDALFGEQPYAAALKARAEQPDLAGRVHFLGFRRDVPELMQCMDVVVHASISAEPLGRVIIEGMLARKPVIATRAGGASEIVINGRSGLLVTPGSIPELVSGLESLQRDPEFARKLATCGRQRAKEMYSLQGMAREITSVLEGTQVNVTTSGRTLVRPER